MELPPQAALAAVAREAGDRMKPTAQAVGKVPQRKTGSRGSRQKAIAFLHLDTH